MRSWRPRAGPGCGARGRWRGLARQLADAPNRTSAHGVEGAGGTGGPGCGARNTSGATSNTAQQGTPPRSGLISRLSTQIRQTADPLPQNDRFSAFFAEWVCTLAATPPPVAASPPPNGGNGVIRRVRRAWLGCPWAAAGPGRASRRRAARQHTRHHWCGGRRRARRARLRYPWAME